MFSDVCLFSQSSAFRYFRSAELFTFVLLLCFKGWLRNIAAEKVLKSEYTYCKYTEMFVLFFN